MREVERDAALVAIEVQEEAALAAFNDRTEPAIFAAIAPLDANHVGAEIRQQHGAIGRGDEAAKIDHANSFEQSGHNDPLLCTAQHRTCWTKRAQADRLAHHRALLDQHACTRSNCEGM